MSIKALAQAVLLGKQRGNRQETTSFLDRKNRKPQWSLGKPGVNVPEWHLDFCEACGDFNHWRGRCLLSLDDCILSRVINAEEDKKRFAGLVIGQGIAGAQIIDLLTSSGEPLEILFSKPLWLFCLAEYLKTHESKG